MSSNIHNTSYNYILQKKKERKKKKKKKGVTGDVF